MQGSRKHHRALYRSDIRPKRIEVPSDISSLPLEKRAQAAKELISEISKQSIQFEFRKCQILPCGQCILKDVAAAMALLPEVSLRLEGHAQWSDYAKAISGDKGSSAVKDKQAMVDLSRERAELVQKVLKAEGVQNDISCIGLGTKGQMKISCVKIIVVPVWGAWTAKRIKVPSDIDSLPLPKRALASKDLVRQISQQRIEFANGDGPMDVLPGGAWVVKDVAKAMAVLPEVSLCIEGHSKGTRIQTPEEKKQMVQWSKERAEAVKKALQAEGVQNKINCVGFGCLEKERFACVKIVVVPATGSPEKSKAVEMGSPVKLGDAAKVKLDFGYAAKKDSHIQVTTQDELMPLATSTPRTHAKALDDELWPEAACLNTNRERL
jgi:outer membrane protein OmpA-like peptidoglycan-associated protein